VSHMSDDYSPERALQESVASLAPILQPGTFVYCSMLHNADSGDAMAVARAFFIEDQGVSLIIPRTEAVRLGLIFDLTLRQITLFANIPPDVIGVTRAVLRTLEKREIPANVVSAAHSDHIFVPARRADEAVEALRSLQKRASDKLV
jgi:hypothetical protein